MELQSASQPRLSYAEMAEDYPRFPDIHDLDLTLLNPRMIVVRRAFLGLFLCCCMPCLSQAVGDSWFSATGRHTIYESFTIYCLPQHPRFSSFQPVQNHGPAPLAGGECGGRGEWLGWRKQCPPTACFSMCSSVQQGAPCALPSVLPCPFLTSGCLFLLLCVSWLPPLMGSCSINRI